MAVLHMGHLSMPSAQQWREAAHELIQVISGWFIPDNQDLSGRELVHFFEGQVGTLAPWTKSPRIQAISIFYILEFIPQLIFPLSQDGSLSHKHHFLTQLLRAVKCRREGIWLASKEWRNFILLVSLSFNLIIKPFPELPTPSQLPFSSHWLELTGSHDTP